ncbi:MAG: RNA pseudouridine synthase [Spirochaetaceae bacterium]|jgi:23S rRNA pseudouridine1911/1915/1917 synthase|nr:RNA pseudouridine synthase [Spirochaetaceae bacterium]
MRQTKRTKQDTTEGCISEPCFAESEQKELSLENRLEKSGSPCVLAETPHYLVVYKPPLLHSVPLRKSKDQTLLCWCAERFPELMQVKGRNPWEGGVLHRLDYETRGLILCARNQRTFEALAAQQKAGLFTKQYRAVSANTEVALLPGFPPRPPAASPPFMLKSAFRAYGKGRQTVRPLTASTVPDNLYTTTIVECLECGATVQWTVQITQGFRHQIRCHLSWLGYPLLNDSLYGGKEADGTLELCAESLSFFEPFSGEPVQWSIS